MVKGVLTAAAVYVGAIGAALLIVPAQFGVDAVPDDPSPALIALLRLLGGPLIGIAVLNWRSRSIDGSQLRGTVLLANLVAFALSTINDIEGVITGDARDAARVFVVVHLAFTVAFAVAWTRDRTTPVSSP
ncbi:hypothetical protein [Luteipulveratus halotolerans]|uniref:Membrane protein n=1 Tax=Luteipulveratus halotolerans TaxID=1631356 RepID=A0A0L6CJR3_9MICO|nr:hypothetical protein [Luteipulveratus halotolerans]KNX37954.1 membrane protein [Luteipulveratus halotolerans]